MKKITLLFAFIGMITLQSCTVNEVENREPFPPDSDTISEVIEVTTSFSSGNSYSRIIPINPPIVASDMVLVYHLYDVINGSDVWRQMPQTYYLSAGGELDYNFDFTRNDINLFLEANFSLNTLSPSWTQNQTFRIVIVPGYFSNKSANTKDGSNKIDLKDYNAVIKAYGIDESKIRKIKS